MNQETVREDQGYKKYPLNKAMALTKEPVRFIKVRLLNGHVLKYAAEFAEDLIRRGKAVLVEEVVDYDNLPF